ncbi:MAG TPA: prephenate dehydratase [Candidatus Acidoferrales bacterium]|nr:prephenate dehydratase [Candidatus Acidoferrales bacterium]
MFVGVLGPEGTYSEMAALALGYPESALCYFPTIEDVAHDVVERRLDCGVIPLENSSEGSVGTTLDVLLLLPVLITHEIVLPIRHHLVAQKGAEIRVVYSHWQAIAQCQAFLRAFGREVIAVSSTSQAARLARENAQAGAITSLRAAERYGLQIIHADIHDVKDNSTKFVVIVRRDTQAEMSAGTKTSIVLELRQNKPGALYEVLHVFAEHQLNLSKIESRPAKRSLGEYVFYIDLEGNTSDPRVISAFNALQLHVSQLKVLGSYSSETHLTSQP